MKIRFKKIEMDYKIDYKFDYKFNYNLLNKED